MRRQDDRIVDGDRVQPFFRRRDQLGAIQDSIGEVLDNDLVPMRCFGRVRNFLARMGHRFKATVGFAYLFDRRPFIAEQNDLVVLIHQLAIFASDLQPVGAGRFARGGDEMADHAVLRARSRP